MAGSVVLESAWEALGENPGHLDAVAPGGHPDLPARVPVAGLVRDSVAAASLAAALLADGRPRPVRLDGTRLAAAVTSERLFRIDGAAPDIWSELSGFWATADGWVRTHANYPHHRGRLLAAVGLRATASAEEFAARLASLDAEDVEADVARAGGVAVRVRTADEWMRHPQARAIAGSPVVEYLPRDPDAGSAPGHSDPRSPLAGVRVLDLTRVLAGPVCTRTLALLGADVLRVDDPALPEAGWQHLDTGAGKRSTLLDLRDRRDRERFEELLVSADVLVSGYRPAALDRFGLGAAALAERLPRLVQARVSAWGATGPWSGRRGFDSIVQAATGIAVAQATGERPGALPAQVLDHSAGYLLAAGAMVALRRRRADGGGATIHTSLARLAQQLLAWRGVQPAADTAHAGPTTEEVRTPAGRLGYTLPALDYEGGPDRWPAPPRPWGGDDARWEARWEKR